MKHTEIALRRPVTTVVVFVALFLASLGVYGVVSFSVNQRTQEIGVRMALGARGRDIVWMVLKQGIAQLADALTLGVGLGYGFLRLIDSVSLANITYHDPGLYLAVAAFLSGAALLATWRPALRASRLYPTDALRED